MEVPNCAATARLIILSGIRGGGLGGIDLRSLEWLGGRKESTLSIYVPIYFAEVCGVLIDIQYPIYTEVNAEDVY